MTKYTRLFVLVVVLTVLGSSCVEGGGDIRGMRGAPGRHPQAMRGAAGGANKRAAAAAERFTIFFGNIKEQVTFAKYSFDVPPWEFGDRVAYRCAWAYLMDGATRVARVQFDRGKSYTAVNDGGGAEAPGEDLSECRPEEEGEVKPKPDGLGDTVVSLSGIGASQSITFPETSPEDPDSWWELEEIEGDHMEIELYWNEEVAAIATITTLSPTLSFAARSTAPPIVNSFSPSGGEPGTEVTIHGVNFLDITSVTFNGVPTTDFEAEGANDIVATVPQGATSGPISVTSSAGQDAAADAFAVPVPGAVAHESKVSLKLFGKLVAQGRVAVPDGAAECIAGRTVVIERKVSGVWKRVGADVTGASGFYRESLKNRSGKYRAKVKQRILENGDICLVDYSKKKRAG